MNAFTIDRKVILMSATDRSLPLNIDVDDDGIGVVLGTDVAKVANLAFRMPLFQDCKGGWHRNTLRELAWQTNTSTPLSTAEYSRLLSQMRKDVTATVMSEQGQRSDIPSTEQILEHRLRPVGHPAWIDGLGERVLSWTDGWLDELNSSTIDDVIKNMVGRAPFPVYRKGEYYEHFTLVVILSETMTDAEQSLFAHYLKKAQDVAPHVRIVLVVENDDVWQKVCRNPEWSVWAQLTQASPRNWPESGANQCQLGHVNWPKGDLDNQIRRFDNLVKKVIYGGGQFSNVTIVAEDFGDAMLIRQNLLDAGIPVNASESYLLPMRPQVLTLMSLLAAALDCGRVQGISRMMEVWSELNIYGIKDLVYYFERLTKWSDEIGKGPVALFMDAMQPLAQLTGDQGIWAWLDAALLAFERLPTPCRHESMLEHARAVSKWGEGFKSPEEMLDAFWRLRANYSEWQAYRDGDGVLVAANPAFVKNEIVVVFQNDGFVNDTVVAVNDVFIAPVTTRRECEV
ncbi:MAG: hypothetical protein WCT04_19965 [Planctomycetota bacterium]